MNEQGLNTGMDRISTSMQKILARSVDKGKMDQAQADKTFQEAFGRITPTTDLSVLHDCDLVIEVRRKPSL